MEPLVFESRHSANPKLGMTLKGSLHPGKAVSCFHFLKQKPTSIKKLSVSISHVYIHVTVPALEKNNNLNSYSFIGSLKMLGAVLHSILIVTWFFMRKPNEKKMCMQKLSALKIRAVCNTVTTE